jgi:starch-binding outer membrane protein, SusD/RagB family
MKFIYKNKFLTMLMAVLVLQSACINEEFLDKPNPNQQTTATFWKTSDDAVKGVNAIYSSLLLDGAFMRFTPLINDTRADDAIGISPWPEISRMGNFSITNNALGPIIAWIAYYQGVFRANQVLENVPNIDMDQELKNRVLGQAYFLRGLNHFYLANFFGNIPIIKSTPKVEQDYFVKQASQAEIWNEIYADFQKAKDLLPVSYNSVEGPDRGNLGRATKGAAAGFLGKAYLFQKRYQDASKEFEFVMTLGYSLVPNYRDNFTHLNENNSESLFEVQFSAEVGGPILGWGGEPNPGWGKASARAVTYGPSGFGFHDILPTRTLYNEFLQEKTVNGQDDPRMHATMFYNRPGMTVYGVPFEQQYGVGTERIFPRKYQNDGFKANEFDWRSGINERLLRYADILLMQAECLNELGRTADAYPLIQQVRNRANLPSLLTTKPGLTQAQMRDQIAHERFLEFAFEGHRFNDIRRWGWLQDPAKLAWLKSRDSEFNGYIAGREFLPIPLEEVEVNKNLIQNPGW